MGAGSVGKIKHAASRASQPASDVNWFADGMLLCNLPGALKASLCGTHLSTQSCR